MTSAHLSLSFCAHKDSCIDTLEAVLAIVRRGGVRLMRLQLHARAAHDAVHLDLRAPDGAQLALVEARVRNLVGAFDVETMISEQEKIPAPACRVALHL